MPQTPSLIGNNSLRSFERGDIEARLKTGADREIAMALKIMLAQYPNARDHNREEAGLRMEGYVHGLRRFGLATITACVDAVMGGDPAFDPRFAPLVSEMSVWCRAYEAFDRKELARAGSPAIAVDKPKQPRPEQMQKLADVVASLDVVIAEDKVILGRASAPSIARKPNG